MYVCVSEMHAVTYPNNVLRHDYTLTLIIIKLITTVIRLAQCVKCMIFFLRQKRFITSFECG